MAADVTGLITALADQVVPITDDAAQAMERDIALSAPVDTGALSRSGNVVTTGDGSGAVATLTFDEDYASYLDEGTGLHTITGNPLLAFEWGGQTVIVHSVQHPGSTKWVGWFSNKAEDDSLWGTIVQSVLDSTVIS